MIGRSAASVSATSDTVELPVEKLLFDQMNPRLVEGDEGDSQNDILKRLWREFAVDEVALSIAANGYFDYEPIFVEPKGSRYLVLEGNRRLAAVRLLSNVELRKAVGATDLPKISAEAKKRLQFLPAIVTTRKKIWQYVGFKHLNGPQQWQSYSKAKYIAWVRNEMGSSLDRIASQIGDQHATVSRLYRAYMVIEQAEEAGVFTREDRSKQHFSFSHLYTGLDYPSIQRFLGLSKTDFSSSRPVPKAKLARLGELCLWLYGSKAKQQPPLVRSQNPDLRTLAATLDSKNGLAALRANLPLQIAHDISQGDERLFREALVSVKQYLQSALGKILTGYLGQRDLVDLAKECAALSAKLVDEMRSGGGRKKSK